ncbi:MAG: hypothetical protein AAGA48_18650 [Myxococcota bacterium]
MARFWLVLASSTFAGCIFIEDNGGNTDGGTNPGDPDKPTQGSDDGVLPATLSDGNVVLTNRVKDPALPDYVAPEGIDVEVELTIEPGVIIEFGNDTTLLIDGRAGGVLNAEGTAAEPIVLTHPRREAGAWAGVYIDNVEASLNRLDYVTIEYGGGQAFGAGLEASNLGVGGFVGNGRIRVTNSMFRNSASHGIEVEGSSALPDFAGNAFSSNAGFDLVIPAEVFGSVADDNAVSPQGISITGGLIETDAVWPAISTLWIEEEVVAQARLELSPGLDLAFGDNVGMVIDGRGDGVLVSVGTAMEPITFRGQNGVTWRGLWIDNTVSNSNAIQFAEFQGGGFEAFERDIAAQLTIGGFVGTSTIDVRDCTFSSTAAGASDIALQSDADVNEDLETANTFDQGVTTF